MKITLVSHASLLVETCGIRLLTDPWYEGTIYHDAWELCPPPPVLPDFRGLDALFISHAHPDHLEPRTLTKIIDARGADLPVFIARFPENSLKPGLEAIGFRDVREMHPGRTFEAFPGVRFQSQQFRLDDSLLVIEGDETLININDCPLRGRLLHDLARRFRPQYVTAQFAIAQGYPYCYDLDSADFDRRDLIARFDSFGQILRPAHLIPFASFVRFCNADNFHMNQHKITLADLAAGCDTPLTVLYPGDCVENGVVTGVEANRMHFEAAERDTSTIVNEVKVSRDELDAAVHRFLRGMARRVPWPLWRRFPDCALIPSGWTVGYCIERGRARVVAVEELSGMPIKYTLHPDVLHACLQFPWGWEDLSIGARFRARVEPRFEGREIWFWIIPILAGKGYLNMRAPWVLHPRALHVMWGRRLELVDYAINAIRGRFMDNVVRRKTTELESQGLLRSSEPSSSTLSAHIGPYRRVRRMQIHYLEIVTQDVEAVCTAYAAASGLQFGDPDTGLGNARTAALPGGGMVGVRAPMRTSEEPVVRPYWLVDDIEAAVDALLEAGSEVAHPPMEIPGHGTFVIYFEGGVQHGLWQL